MKIGLVGQSYTERSLPFDAQRTINLYPVLDQLGKEVSALYGTPGLKIFATAGAGAGRGCYYAANGRAFVVTGSELYEVLTNGTTNKLGNLNTNTGPITIDENGLQLGICDGTYVYIFTYASNSFGQVTDPDLPIAGSITFIDGYFVINKVGTGQFFISALYDGTSWAALDFATAESSPDNLLRVINAVGQLWLMGDKTGEIWTNTGASAFPFERISGAKMEAGIVGAQTAVAVDNSLLWVGKTNNGPAIVYRAQGFSPLRISTSPIEQILQTATDPINLKAYAYQQDGHTFYVLTGGGMMTTLVYDISTQLWHERAYLNSFGVFEQHLGLFGMFAFNMQLVISRNNGKVYQMALTYYDDDGAALASDRVYTHIGQENKRIRYNQLEIAMETGVGNPTAPIGNLPVISLSRSTDGGRKYSTWYTASVGAVGQYLVRAVFRRIGIAYQITFRVRITDAVKRSLIGSYLS